jgi:hypothetical protein
LTRIKVLVWIVTNLLKKKKKKEKEKEEEEEKRTETL